jgi:REP element-mobilizing transposase RayT
MGYDPEKHHRGSIRIKGYDYALPGAYFVTLLCSGRSCYFGEIVEGKTRQTKIGNLVHQCWMRIPNYFDCVRLDEFILMPNHLHGIIFIYDSLGKGEAFAKFNSNIHDSISANASPLRQIGTQPGSLEAIIQNFKSVSTRLVNTKHFKPGHKIWQRNYYERIIRNERELNAIRQYILDNPLNWEVKNDNPFKVDR